MHIEQNTRKLKVRFKRNLRKNPTSTFLVNILNNDCLDTSINLLRKSVKKPLRIRGRHHDRKGLFAQVGRTWSPKQRNSNDIPKSLWKYCDHFSIYIRG